MGIFSTTGGYNQPLENEGYAVRICSSVENEYIPMYAFRRNIALDDNTIFYEFAYPFKNYLTTLHPAQPSDVYDIMSNDPRLRLINIDGRHFFIKKGLVYKIERDTSVHKIVILALMVAHRDSIGLRNVPSSSMKVLVDHSLFTGQGFGRMKQYILRYIVGHSASRDVEVQVTKNIYDNYFKPTSVTPDANDISELEKELEIIKAQTFIVPQPEPLWEKFKVTPTEVQQEIQRRAQITLEQDREIARNRQVAVEAAQTHEEELRRILIEAEQQEETEVELDVPDIEQEFADAEEPVTIDLQTAAEMARIYRGTTAASTDGTGESYTIGADPTDSTTGNVTITQNVSGTSTFVPYVEIQGIELIDEESGDRFGIHDDEIRAVIHQVELGESEFQIRAREFSAFYHQHMLQNVGITVNNPTFVPHPDGELSQEEQVEPEEPEEGFAYGYEDPDSRILNYG